MKQNAQKTIPALLERYELKFTIPSVLVDPISEFASAYCSLDKYSKVSENGYYRVNSLYLDTPGYLFLKKRMEGAENRFNMRVRSYGDNPTMPYFLEIKQRSGGTIKKFRASVKNENWYKVYTEPGFKAGEVDNDPMEIRNRALFERMIYTYNLSPKILTQYRRKAWVSEIDEYARLTFDVDLRYKPESNYNLVPREEEMVPSDQVLLFDPGCSVILELKCYASRVPLWMIDLVKYFDLRRRSFSKYKTGAMEIFQIHHHDAASRVAMIY